MVSVIFQGFDKPTTFTFKTNHGHRLVARSVRSDCLPGHLEIKIVESSFSAKGEKALAIRQLVELHCKRAFAERVDFEKRWRAPGATTFRISA